MPISPRLVPFGAIVVVWCAISYHANAQIQFVEVGDQRGIEPFAMAAWLGGGAAVADFDNDGDIDIFVPNAAGVPDQLYRNLGTGQFEEIAGLVGLASIDRSRLALWFDYDADGLLDLAVATDCCCQDNDSCDNLTPLRLFHQIDDGQFVDVTVAAGLVEDATFVFNMHRGGICAGDINRDGFPELLVTTWHGRASLFLNNTDGTFTDIGISSGVGVESASHWQPMMHDFDGDGWVDIYIAIDFAANRLWVNQHDNTFVDIASQAGLDNAMNDMGMSLGDYDNDGDLDIYITNRYSLPQNFWNVLLRNDSTSGQLSFTDVAPAAGVENGYWGWGTTFMDADNDGLLDIAETNGYFSNPVDPSKFFLNVGGDPVTFADVSTEVGFDDTNWGSALMAFDSDRDGDLDMLEVTAQGGPLRLLENQPAGPGPANNYLVVRPRMLGPNHRGLGAIIRAQVGATTQMRLITAGTSFMGQEPAEAFFGVGQATTVDTLIVEWPDGSRTQINGVPTNQAITLTHGLDGDHDADLDVDLDDYARFLDCRTVPGGGLAALCAPFDGDSDGDVDAADFAAFQRFFTGPTGAAQMPAPVSRRASVPNGL